MADLFETEETIEHGANRFADVAIERGIDLSPTGLTYRVPGSLEAVAVGQRVVVPLGRKKAQGYIIRLHSDPPDYDASKIKLIQEVAPGSVALPGDLVELARWIANYYVCPLGMVFSTMLPAAVTRGTGMKQKQVVRLSKPSRAAADDLKVTKTQQRLLDAAEQHNDWLPIKDLADLAEVKTTGPVKKLIEKGLLENKFQDAVHSDLDLR
ncbi:MAG: hypothetical protein AAF085_05195, partial [Planctomycetota bacterium]